MTEVLHHHTHAFGHLHTDVNRRHWTAATGYRAPHKMLLLLAVLDLAEEGALPDRFVAISPALLDRFAGYWSAVMPLGSRGDVCKPFFHLRSDGFWHLVAKPGREQVLAALGTCHSMRQLLDNVLGATLDDALFALLQDAAARQALRTTLLGYFDDTLGRRLLEWLRVSHASYEYSQQLFDWAHEKSVADAPAPPATAEPVEIVRDQGFRKAVVTAYEHRCAFCGIRMLTPQGHTAVDAAHIVPWAETRNDDIRNGLALCKLCHWAFDEFLVSVSAGCRLLTSPLLTANANLPGHLLQMRDREILVPADPALHPAEPFLSRHRRRFAAA